MGRGGAIYMSYTALVLLSAISSVSASIWDVNIDLGPAPSPEDGPPFSAHATRNRALIPYQVIGIVGSYLGFVFILGTLLLTVGRRLRNRARSMANQPTEMVKPYGRVFEQSPMMKSQASLNSLWRSRGNSVRSKRSANNVVSPGGYSLKSVDEDVLKRDKERADEEMSRLYGAVYDFDENVAQQPVSATEVLQDQQPYGNPATLRPDLQRVQSSDSYSYSPTTPLSPSFRAIYPPHDVRGGQQGVPMSPREQPLSPARSYREVQLASAGSNTTFEPSSTQSPRRARKGIKRSIKDLKISAPIQKFLTEDNSDGARTPLSPNYFANPGNPPDPPTAGTMDSRYQPPTPATGRTMQYPETTAEDGEAVDQVRDLPHPNPQRARSTEWPLQDVTTPKSGIKRGNATAPRLDTSLPFRQYRYQQDAAQQRQFPMSPASWNPLSAGPTKTTFLETRGNHLGAPLTGVPTPYSPYMPYDLVTPVTPRIFSKAERKQREKEERAMRGPATEKDQVADDKEMWDSAY